MAISNYLENKILNHTLNNVPYTQPEVVYLALFKSDPTDDNIGEEVNGNGYARKPIKFNEPSNGSISNSVAITMPIATGEWGTITHVGIMDNLINGNLLYYGQLDIHQNIQSNNQLFIDTNQLTITLD